MPPIEKATPTELRTLGARRPATKAAHGKTLRGLELLVVQSVRLPEDDESLAAKQREQARALTKIRQPNVAALREVIEGDEAIVFVTEFVEGVTYGDLIRIAAEKDHDLALGVHLRIVLDCLAGLGAIHGARDRLGKSLGRFHGDLALENAVIGLDGVAKLVSWCPGGTGGESTPEHVRFMAPEVLLGDDTADLRVDLYAVGVLLYEALSGRRIFHDTGAGAILAKHLAGKVEAPTVPESAPWAAPLVQLVQRAISTDPAQRQATAAEVAAELRRIAGTNLASASTVSALVKKLAGDIIDARRAELAPPGAVVVKPAAAPAPPKPKPLAATAIAIAPPIAPPIAPAAPAAAAAPVPAPAAAAVPAPAPKPAAAPALAPAPTPLGAGDSDESFRLDLLESEPPPPPPPGAFQPEQPPMFGSIGVVPELEPEPAPPRPPIDEPPPIAPLEPLAVGAGALEARRRRTRAAVVALLAIAAVILLYVGVRAVARRGGDDETKEKPVAGATTKATATAAVTTTAPATETATAAATVAATATATATATETAAAAGTEAAAGAGAGTGTGTGTGTVTGAGTGTGGTATGAATGTAAPYPTKVTPKGKPTYDPLGI